MSAGKRYVWGGVIVLAVAGVLISEVAKRQNVHDYAALRKEVTWPDRLTLDRSDLARYLRSQFNVQFATTEDDGPKISVRAGLCQLGSVPEPDATDFLAAKATLAIARQPWFDQFVEVERQRLAAYPLSGPDSAEKLRQLFVQDIVARDEFQAEFPQFLEHAARDRDIVVQWISADADQARTQQP